MANAEGSMSDSADRSAPLDNGSDWWSTVGTWAIGAFGLSAPLVGFTSDSSGLTKVLAVLVATVGGGLIGFAVHRDRRAKKVGTEPAKYTTFLVLLGALTWLVASLVPVVLSDSKLASAEDNAAPAGTPSELTECASFAARVDTPVTRVLNDAEPCAILEYDIGKPDGRLLLDHPHGG